MKQFILENIGTIFYLIGCIITYFLLSRKNKDKFDWVVVFFIALSWVSIALALKSLADKHYKSIEK